MYTVIVRNRKLHDEIFFSFGLGTREAGVFFLSGESSRLRSERRVGDENLFSYSNSHAIPIFRVENSNAYYKFTTDDETCAAQFSLASSKMLTSDIFLVALKADLHIIQVAAYPGSFGTSEDAPRIPF